MKKIIIVIGLIGMIFYVSCMKMPPPPFPIGEVTDPHWSYDLYCKENPTDEFCGEKEYWIAKKVKVVVDIQFRAESQSTWGSYADLVIDGKPFTGNCKNYAMTVADILLQGGAEPDKVYLVDCTTHDGEAHLVCMYGGYVIDNMYRAIYTWKELPYTWNRVMKMSEKGTWRKVNPEGE